MKFQLQAMEMNHDQIMLIIDSNIVFDLTVLFVEQMTNFIRYVMWLHWCSCFYISLIIHNVMNMCYDRSSQHMGYMDRGVIGYNEKSDGKGKIYIVGLKIREKCGIKHIGGAKIYAKKELRLARHIIIPGGATTKNDELINYIKHLVVLIAN